MGTSCYTYYMKKNSLPSVWKPFLWSYDTSKLDVSKDKQRIITNVLNTGTQQATKLLFKTYPKKEIIKVVKHPMPGEWNKKSLNFWGLMLNVKPQTSKRKIPQ